METVGQRIMALRKSKGLTQTELGEQVNISASGISAIEMGKSEAAETITAIANHFKQHRDWLLTGQGETPKGVVIPIRKELAESPWKDALVMQLKEENQRLWKIVEHLTGGKASNFLQALNTASTTGKLVQMHNGTGVLLGAQA